MGVPSANTVVFLPDCENIEGPMAGGGSSARPAPPVGATPLVVPGAMDPASMVALAAFICWRRAGEDRGEADLELWCAGSDAPSGNKSRKTISQWCDLVETLLPERSRQLRAVAAFEESPAWETLLQAALMAIGQLEGEGEKSVTMEELCNSPSV